MIDAVKRALSTEEATPYKRSGFNRAWFALKHSLAGLGSALKHESAFRQEAILACILLPLAIIMPIGLLGKALMILSIFLVLIVELLNSAVEWVTDYISLDRHPYAKRVKDIASAAVLLALIHVAVIWGLVIASEWDALVAWVS